MRDEECVRFLQAILPELGLRWPGFRKVRRQVCRSLRDRAAELGLGGYAAPPEDVGFEPWPGEPRLYRRPG